MKRHVLDWRLTQTPYNSICSQIAAQGTYRTRLFSQRDFAQDRQHQYAADETEGRDEIKIATPASVEQSTEKNTGETAAKILEGIDHAGSEAGHFCSADVHCRRRSKDGMRRIGGERNQNEKKIVALTL